MELMGQFSVKGMWVAEIHLTRGKKMALASLGHFFFFFCVCKFIHSHRGEYQQREAEDECSPSICPGLCRGQRSPAAVYIPWKRNIMSHLSLTDAC